MTALERIKALIPADDRAEATDESLQTLLDQAKDTILAYCNRRELPDGLIGAQVQLAIIYFNRQGMEGEQSHSEGGVSRTVYVLGDDIPKSILSQLTSYRLLRMVLHE